MALVSAPWGPNRWTREQLADARAGSLGLLNGPSGKAQERRSRLYDFHDDAVGAVRELLDLTENLRSLEARALVEYPHLLPFVRFLAAPPISNDDLERLVGASLPAKGVPKEFAKVACDLILPVLDERRFPWLRHAEDPSIAELNGAVVATAALWATERARTMKRMEAKSLEVNARQRLASAGLAEVSGSVPNPPWGLPVRSYLRSEAIVAGKNCDVVVHLRASQRALLCECKFASTEINGTKRLKEIKEAAQTWRTAFGSMVVVVGIVAGAFKLEQLEEAQNSGVFIVWEHDLEPLAKLVEQSL